MIEINFPKSFSSGDSLKADLSGTRKAYPTSDYSLLFVYQISGRQHQVQIGDDRQLFVSWTSTKAWTGAIPWRIYATTRDGSDRATIASGELQAIKPFSVSAMADELTHEEKVLAAIEAILENQASHEQASISINGRMLTRRSTTELFELRQKYLDLVRQAKAIEKNGGKLAFGKIRLTTPRE